MSKLIMRYLYNFPFQPLAFKTDSRDIFTWFASPLQRRNCLILAPASIKYAPSVRRQGQFKLSPTCISIRWEPCFKSSNFKPCAFWAHTLFVMSRLSGRVMRKHWDFFQPKRIQGKTVNLWRVRFIDIVLGSSLHPYYMNRVCCLFPMRCPAARNEVYTIILAPFHR